LKKYTIKQYESSLYAIWNAFISKAKNATFLFHRDFMEYHKDRFEDNSLLIYEDDLCVAVLPANKIGATTFSHQGLGYGGLLYDEQLSLDDVIACFLTVLLFLNNKGIVSLTCKTVPSFYHKKPAEEFGYALFLANAKLVRRDTLAVIDLKKDFSFSKVRKRGIQKAIKNNLIIKEETDFESFWNQILIPNLAIRHKVKPVHALNEIEYLKNRFPNNIRQFNVYCEDQIVAGTTIFETETTAHCQYISKFENKVNLGSLDFLYDYLIHTVFAEKQFFDFGSSNENQGRKLNIGLSKWKESFGARTVVQDFYELETASYYKLETAII
jgi:hypothetical protein